MNLATKLSSFIWKRGVHEGVVTEVRTRIADGHGETSSSPRACEIRLSDPAWEASTPASCRYDADPVQRLVLGGAGWIRVKDLAAVLVMDAD